METSTYSSQPGSSRRPPARSLTSSFARLLTVPGQRCPACRLAACPPPFPRLPLAYLLRAAAPLPPERPARLTASPHRQWLLHLAHRFFLLPPPVLHGLQKHRGSGKTSAAQKPAAPRWALGAGCSPSSTLPGQRLGFASSRQVSPPLPFPLPLSLPSPSPRVIASPPNPRAGAGRGGRGQAQRSLRSHWRPAAGRGRAAGGSGLGSARCGSGSGIIGGGSGPPSSAPLRAFPHPHPRPPPWPPKSTRRRAGRRTTSSGTMPPT